MFFRLLYFVLCFFCNLKFLYLKGLVTVLNNSLAPSNSDVTFAENGLFLLLVVLLLLEQTTI